MLVFMKSILAPLKSGKRIVTRLVLAVLLGGVFITAQATTQTAPVAAATCHSHWIWHHGNRGFTPYTEVKWTSNRCGNLIRNRSICFNRPLHTYPTDPSGIVVKVGLKARTYCKNSDYNIYKGQMQWRRPGPGRQWSAWKTFWTASF